MSNEYKIVFKTEADTTGAKQTADELKKVNEAVGGSKVPTEQAAAATEKHEGITGKHIKGLKQLKHEIPGLSGALYTLTNAYAAVGVAVSSLIGWLASLKKKWDDLAEADATSAAAMTAFDGRIDRQKDKLKELVDMMGQYAKAIEAVNQASLGMDQELKDQNDAIDEQLKLDVKRLENEKKIALAQLNANKGDMPEERFIRQQGKIEAEADAQIHAAQQGARGAKQGNMAAFHMRARAKEKDQQDAAAQFAADTAAAEARLKDFDRSDAGQKLRREQERKDLQEMEKKARLDIAEHSVAGGMWEVGDTGPAAMSQHRIEREAKLKDAEQRLQAATRGQRFLDDSEEKARRTREGLVDDVNTSKGLFADATKAGAGMRGLANSTQRGAIGLGQESNRAEAGFRNDQAAQSAITRVNAEAAARVAAAVDNSTASMTAVLGKIEDRLNAQKRELDMAHERIVNISRF